MNGTGDLISLALLEDLGAAGDVTSRAFISAGSVSRARIVSRCDCIASGIATAAEVFHRVDPSLSVTAHAAEGDHLAPGSVLLEISGPTCAILSAERTALNFLGRLCGIATLSRRFADAVRGTKAVLLDTRKTTPGWRLLDAVLVKDNHLAALGDLALLPPVITRLHAEHPGLPIEIEADTLGQAQALLGMKGIDVILLDNMGTLQMTEAVALRDRLAPGVLLEASGGVTLATVAGIAATGVDRISVGALTHSATNADLSLEMEPRDHVS